MSSQAFHSKNRRRRVEYLSRRICLLKYSTRKTCGIQMRLLELFAGTGSVGRAFRDQGWEVIGLDINPGHEIKCDIMLWDPATYPRDHFDCIHASPPCTEYSIAKTVGARDLEKADAIVSKTLDIISYYDAPLFIIENPNTGLLKSRPCFAGMGVQTRDYLLQVRLTLPKIDSYLEQSLRILEGATPLLQG